ncbi:unnamed protein product [Thlaspi arvense]|uniref:Calmodulin-binding domain-containing protein n=1 Tax=Thlaspi arvense TaxID=13288 RepID=A0AAU9SWW2_THLAR|nr:unnamed protein product [Thlaspi arvense]
MSNPMFAEKWESSSRSSRREHKRRERKMWKKPIRISRLPSFGFSGSDFTIDQIPAIFSGYTAESEDSSSSEMSDDSRTCSKSSDENAEIDQASLTSERSESVRRRANLKSISRISSMKVLRRQSTRKLSAGGGHRLKKMRSMKRLTSNSRHILRKKALDSISRDDLGLLEPHYLRPTSSSASKNVENNQKSLQAARLKRIASLRYSGLLKATCSSAMKGSSSSSKKSNDVCNYKYCSLHGRLHSHAADNSVTVPSLKRFVSMRRKFLKRQKSVNRRLVLLKRTLSRKRRPLSGPIVTDLESKQMDDDDNADGDSDQELLEEEVSSSENCGNNSESNGGSTEMVMVDVDGGMDSVETNASAERECVQESKPEVMDESDGRIDKDSEKNADHDDEVVEETKSEETDEKKTENVWSDTESKPEIMDDSDGMADSYERIDKDFEESKVTGLCYDEGTKSGEIVEDHEEEVCREDDGKNTENVWNDTVTLVKQAFDEILAEITDDDSSDDNSSVTISEGVLAKEYDVGEDSSDCSDMPPTKRRDTHLSVIISNSHMGEESEHRRGAKKWSYLKRVILLKRFLKSLDRRARRKLPDGEESEALMRLRRELVGERKNAEEWMLDHALKQVISTLAPSQKRKVKHLVKAFESLIPMDGGSRGHDDLASPGREESETVNSQTTILRDNKDTTDQLEVLPERDLEETKLTSEASSSLSIGMKSDEALESVADSSHHIAVEKELDGPASVSSIEEEEKTGDSEKKNLSTWRNLIQKHMTMRDNNEMRRGETEQEHKWSYVTDQMTGIEKDGDVAAVKSVQQAFEMILSEIPDPSFDDEEIGSESSNSLKEEKEGHGETKRSWNSLRKVILLKRFVNSLEKVRDFNPRKLRNLPVESELGAENVLLRHLSTMERRTVGEERMLDYAMRQAISRLAPIQRKKVELLVQAFDTVLDGHETPKQSKSNDNKEETAEGAPRVVEDCEVNEDEQRIKNVFSRFQVHQKILKQEDELDTPRNNVETGEEGTLRVEEDCEVNKDEQRIKSTFSRFQVHHKDLKGEEEVDSTPRKSRDLLPPIRDVKQRIVVEKEKDSRMWKLIYKHMVTEKEETGSANGESVASVESEFDDEAGGLQIDERRSGTVTLVREALEKILSEIPDNSSDDQSMDSDITTDQELLERNSLDKPKSNEKRVKGWNNVKKVILLKRFVSDLGSMTRLSPKTPRVLPWEPDPETEKIRLRHQEIGGKRNSEEWMLDYALRQAISTLAPSQKRKVSLLAQAFDTISFGSCSTPGSATTSRNISRQSSLSSATGHTENEAHAEIIRGRLRNLQEDLRKTTKPDPIANDVEEKQQCSSLWRLLCKQMEDNERNQTLPEETRNEEVEEEEELKEDSNVDGGKMELYQTEAVELLGEVIDGISLEENQDQNLIQGETKQKIETLRVSQARINRWSNLKRVILLRRFVKALENVRKFNPREPRFLPSIPEIESEKVNLRHHETQNKRSGEEWMVDNALQGVVSKLTPARKLKVQLLVQAFETLSATGNCDKQNVLFHTVFNS